MLTDYWRYYIKHPDPGYQRLLFSLRVILSVGIPALILYYANVSQYFWGILASLFLSLSSQGIGFIGRSKRLIVSAILCVLAVFIGSLAGLIFPVYAVLLFMFGFLAFRQLSKGPAYFSMLMLPIFALIRRH